MQYAIVFGAAALAHLSSATALRHAHERFHKRAIVTDYEIDYVTVYTTVTVGAEPTTLPAAQEQWAHSPSHGGWGSSDESAASSTSAPTASSYVAPASSSAAAAPVADTTWTTSAAAAPTSYAASSSYTSSASAASSASVSASSGVSPSNLTPGGKKAGLSGYIGCQDTSAFTDLAPYISWYSDYTANTTDAQGVQGIGMLWAGPGSACGSLETDRLDTFTSLTSTPSIMFGFYEPDCSCDMSSEMSVSSAASSWDSLLAPLAAKGTVLGSPPLCKQLDETFLAPFGQAISGTWDVTSVHINKPNVSEAQKVVEYYKEKYGKPVWVSEFACVNDQPSWNVSEVVGDGFGKDLMLTTSSSLAPTRPRSTAISPGVSPTSKATQMSSPTVHRTALA